MDETEAMVAQLTVPLPLWADLKRVSVEGSQL
jgi:hypothetical protein